MLQLVLVTLYNCTITGLTSALRGAVNCKVNYMQTLQTYTLSQMLIERLLLIDYCSWQLTYTQIRTLYQVHYNDVIMTTVASQITSITVVYSIVYSGADQRKHQSSASLAFVWGIHRTGEFPAQMASYKENVSIWWRHHGWEKWH